MIVFLDIILHKMVTVEGLLSEANAAAPFELLFTHAWLVLVRDSDWHLSLPQGWFSQIYFIQFFSKSIFLSIKV